VHALYYVPNMSGKECIPVPPCISRFSFTALKHCIMTRLLFCAFTLLFPTLSHAEQKPYNFIFILVDDWGWTDGGCFGSDTYETPNIDRLAAEGMKFTSGYAACTVCSPTRAAAMTGKYPARLRVTDWIAGHRRPHARLAIPDWTKFLVHREVSIAEALKAAGYKTCQIGKWHLGNDSKYWPASQGFDEVYGGYSRGQPPSYFAPYRIPTLKEGPKGEYLTDREADEALGFIARNKDRPFFIYLPHYAVHTPIQSKQALTQKYEAKITADSRHRNAKYAGMVHSVDDSTGRIMAKLKELKIDERTVIILTGDNGGLNGVTRNLPLRAGKGSAYEGGVRVPLVIKWPGTTPAGSVCHEPVITPDFYPTILDIAGVEGDAAHNSKVDGKSIAALLKKPDSRIERDGIYWHYPHYHPGGATPHGAIRDRDWKLIEFYEDMHAELYNLKDDIGETIELSAKHPEEAKELLARLHEWRKTMDAQMPTPNPDYDPTRKRSRGRESFSKKTEFRLKHGDGLQRSKAPNVKGRPFTVEAVFAAEGDGVVVAQGGVGAGYTLYLKDGKLNFATKHDNKGTHIVTNEKIPAGKVTAQVSLAKDGTIVITVNGKEAARGKTRGPLLMTPIDGLQVGSDPNSPVYNYKAPFPLQGKVESVHIELD